jgi:rubrerythrin
MPQTTLGTQATNDNLSIAFEEEVNTQARYGAYAVRAEADGLSDVAVLLRAIARAEQIHAECHGRAIHQAGIKNECVIHDFSVRSTLENLRTALRYELYEIETMYPKYLAEATMDRNGTAIRSFGSALEAEKTHARLLGETIKRAETGTAPWMTAHHLYVCRACGHISGTADGHVICPMYSSPERFDVIGTDTDSEPKSFSLAL